MKLVKVTKEKDDVIVDIKMANAILEETIKEKDEVIAKSDATLKANEQELNDANSILKNL